MIRDPLRLLDDPTTAAALRHDLGAARGPQVGYDVEAGLGRFESTLASDLAAGTGGSGRSGAISGALYSGLVIGALLLVGGLATTLNWQPAGPTVEPAEAQIGSPAVGSPAFVLATQEVTPVAPVAAFVDPPTLAADEEVGADDGSEAAMTARRSRTRKTQASRGARHEVSAVTQAGDYLREARALNAARGMLTGDPAQALKLAQAGAAKFRAGTFAPEWEGVAVLALVELGRDDEARTRGEAYLQRHPSGTFAPRIRQALTGPR